MANAQEWLNKVKHQQWKLTGSLNLNDFINLEELECYNNRLEALNLRDCKKLVRLDCAIIN